MDNVDVANIGLVQLGAETISALDEDSPQAKKINAIFEYILKEVLRAHPWNFAIARASLAQLTTSPEFDYTYAFQLPSDCLKVIRLEDTFDDFKIEGDTLVTDASSVNLKYIKYVADPNEWDSGFITAFATRIAAEITFGLTGSLSLQAAKFDEYARKLGEARSLDAQEGKASVRNISSWLSDRGGNSADNWREF